MIGASAARASPWLSRDARAEGGGLLLTKKKGETRERERDYT